MAFLLSGHVLLISLIFLPVVPCSYDPNLAQWMQDGESGVFLEDHSYPTIWNTVGRSPLSRTGLCLARKSRNFRCHKTRRHISMMILLLMLSGDVEINPGPVPGRNQPEQRDFRSGPFMEKYKDRFLRCMNTYFIAPDRRNTFKVIPEDLYHQIDQKLITGSEANEKLYLHLRSNAKSDTIRHLCDVMTGQNGYPLMMKELGEDMKKDVDLPLSNPSSQPPTVPHPPHPEPTPPSSTVDDERSRKLKQISWPNQSSPVRPVSNGNSLTTPVGPPPFSETRMFLGMERVGSSPLSSILGPLQEMPHSMPNVTRLPWQQTSSPFVEQSQSLPISSVPTENPVQPGPGNLDNWDPMMDDFSSPTFNTYNKGPSAHLPQPRAPEIKL